MTCIKVPHGFKTFVLSIFKWLLKTGFTVWKGKGPAVLTASLYMEGVVMLTTLFMEYVGVCCACSSTRY